MTAAIQKPDQTKIQINAILFPFSSDEINVYESKFRELSPEIIKILKMLLIIVGFEPTYSTSVTDAEKQRPIPLGHNLTHHHPSF